MTTTETDPEPPYLVFTEGSMRNECQSISLHPSYQNMSPEELRLQHYDTYSMNLKPYLGDASKLMATQPLSTFKVKLPSRPIRAAAGGTQRLNGDVIIFVVGTYAPERYSIHERLISHRSEFVRLALRGEWKEAQERTIQLPEDDTEVFSVYQQWLYSGLIHTSCDTSFSGTDNEYETLVKAYILGEKFMDTDFKDAIMDAIVDKLRSLRRFDTRLTTLVFSNTPSTSPLRRFWMDAYYYFGSPEWLNATSVGSPINTEFMVEFSRHQMQFRRGSEECGPHTMFWSCTYHEHGTNPCQSQKMNNF